MAAPPVPKLFQPIRVGTTNLQHRVVLAPMTRCRADAQHVPGALILEYYKQRTSVPGTLAITEATFIDACAGGYTNIPGIWNDEQVAGWKPVRPCPLLPFLPCSRSSWSSSSLFCLFKSETLPTSKLYMFVPSFAADRGRRARKPIVHIPPAVGARTRCTPGCPTERRRPSVRRTQPNPASGENRQR